MNRQALTVRQLNLYVRSLIEGDIRLSDVLVTGEISNFKNHYHSGHLYFTLKDKDASIRCVMFRSSAAKLRFEAQDGLKVILRGRVSIYEKDGQYQFYAEEMQPSGVGDIALAFEQIKEKLEKEGLFNPESKRPIPKYPTKIAVVTSETGAAVRDIINVITRRWPIAEIIMCPVAVQGQEAVPEMLNTLDRIYSLSGIDTVIIGRGGGSIEDLWAFNDEALARKLYESPIPVISAVGHETDFTICDFVADLRAPTPSAAAELAVPDIEEIKAKTDKYYLILKTFLQGKYNNLKVRFSACLNSQCLKNPVDFIVGRPFENLDRLVEKIESISEKLYTASENKLCALAGRLEAMSPLKVISRGFAVVSNKGKAVTTVKDIKLGDEVDIKLSDGNFKCSVIDIENQEGTV
ncbi:MAG: exodeoxyribonuclease VII large subunit [Clostridia bacterium]|nr:exodeoxyribonuclease VII large subunit [Clostridia bacterium]